MPNAIRTAKDVESPLNADGFRFCYDDGGRQKYGVEHQTGDCGVRAVAIATGRDYEVVRTGFQELLASRRGQTAKKPESVKTGLKRTTVGKYLGSDWEYISHYRMSPMPRFVASQVPTEGTVILVLRNHFCPVIDGEIHDLFDPSGSRAIVYGLFKRASSH
jgi:hypothetical protein